MQVAKSRELAAFWQQVAISQGFEVFSKNPMYKCRAN
jgi:hypothetical protein